MKITIALTLLAASATAMSPQQVLAQLSEEPRGLPIGTCINMGNSLEPEQEGSWGGQPIAAKDFEIIKNAGFDTVRIPVRWHNKSLSEAPYTVDTAWMDRVAEVVDQALAADLNVILNSHHFDPIYQDPLGVSDWHGGVWEQIAQRFADYPENRLWFELENEPHDKFDNKNLLETLSPALAAVRASNPTRPVVYGGEDWSSVDSLATLPLPQDPNVYPTFHYYEPFDFTHQGAEWVSPNVPTPGRSYGTAADRERLEVDVAKVERFIERTGLLPFMGETGAYDLHIGDAERVQYHSAIHEAFAPTGIGMCVWGYANTFPFYRHSTGSWVPGLLASIGLEGEKAALPPAIEVVEEGPEPRGRQLPRSLEQLDAALPGWLVNDPSSLAWDTYGDTLDTETVQDPGIPGGGAAIRFTVNGAGESWSAGAIIPLVADVETGRAYVAGFWARGVSGPGQLSVRFQMNNPPYPGFGDTIITLTDQWRFYQAAAVANRDIARGDAKVSLQFGSAEQTFEIGQAIIVAGAGSIGD